MRGCLVVDAGYETARAHQRQQPLELGADGLLTLVQNHLIKMADHAKLRVLLAKFNAVDYHKMGLARKNTEFTTLITTIWRGQKGRYRTKVILIQKPDKNLLCDRKHLFHFYTHRTS